MKIAIATMNGGADDTVSPIFGRCCKYTVIDCVGDAMSDPLILDNPGFTAQGGAGILAAQFVVEQDTDIVVAGNFGPKAAAVLAASKTKMIRLIHTVRPLSEYRIMK
ncbi:NifB/NifX family molybdenum-iron cluster-binding protein, partial [Candidatus Altiarchaeota archaeon]